MASANGSATAADDRGSVTEARSNLLEVDDVWASYGKNTVLFGVSISIPVGARLALLGTNGAGKSTLLRTIAGLVACGKGRVVLDGRDITAMDPVRRVSEGICLVAGGRMVCPTLSVLDNLRIGAYPILRNRALVRERVEEACEVFPHLRTLLNRKAGALSSGEKQMVGLSRAIMAQPKLLMIDEFSLGLAPIIVDNLIPSVEGLSARGITILLVEQSLEIARRLSDTCYFLERGAVKFEGSTAELVDRGDVARAVFFRSRGGDEDGHDREGSDRGATLD